VLVVNRASFERRWSDDRADLLRITYQPGEDGSAVRRAIAAQMAGSQPALISTRAELVAEARQAIDSFVVFTRITAIMAAAVAFINVVTALVISVAERARELALLRVLGAVDAQINRLVIVEAVIVTMGGLALAVPVGAGLAWLFTRALMTAYFGFYMRPAYAYDLLLTLTVVLPLVAAFAAWLTARRAAAARPQFALGHE
jgi:putative ABC transport system permease protein